MPRTMLLVLVVAGSLSAQYFGKNKVQYEDFDFKELETGTFKILYYPAESVAVADAARMLRRWRARLDQVFDTRLPSNQPIILYANHADFQQTNAIPGRIPQATGGVTEGLMNRIVMPLTGVYKENDHILGHELTHAYHYRIIQQVQQGGFVGGGAGQLPLWFIEGMSEYLSIGSVGPQTAMWMRDAVLHERLPSIRQIGTSAEYFPYRYGHAVWAYIAGTWGDTIISPLFRTALRRGLNRAFREHLGIDEETLTERWRQATRQTLGGALNGRTPPDELGDLLIEEEELNLSPSLSPDGNYLAFISARGLFTIELYLADARSGEVITQLTSSLADEHFDALRFFNSSGTWSPDGKRFAFTVFKEGDNAVAIAQVPSGNLLRTFKVDGVGAITQLAWSPDGRYLAVAGDKDGIGDLFLYDMESRTVTNLTNDRYAQLQPAWSPDGKYLAYVTDNVPGTDMEKLVFAPVKIAVMDVASRAVQTVSIADWATHKDPQFSADGRSLYFVCNPDGVPNVFRYSFDTQQYSRVTDVSTGIAGLTDLSPALSLSRTGQMAMTVFTRSNYQIRTMQTQEGSSFQPERQEYLANVTLPPVTDDGDVVVSYLQEAAPQLLAAPRDTISDYSPGLQLYYIGQAFGGLVVDRAGVGVGGGISFLFSDLLGNNLLGISAQASGNIADIGGEVFYLNRDRRWDIGVSLSHLPSFTTAVTDTGSETVSENGEQIEASTVTIVDRRVFLDQARLWAEYPFSLNRRMEFGASYQRYWYDFDAEKLTGVGSTLLSRQDVEVSEPEALNLFSGSAAYVGDYSFFGLVSPVQGRRYRVEVEPTTGSLTYLNALFDYRQYLFWNPFTMAYRLLHYGRYLSDSDNDRLSELFLGRQTLVRGYGSGTFDLSDCAAGEDFESCPEFDRLLGSRIGIANLELRIPVLGTERFGLLPFPYLPLELAGFADAGLAWSSDEEPVIQWDTDTRKRVPVASAGAAARIGILRAFVLQFYYAYPFQRTDSNREWGLLLAPGW